MIGNAIDHFGLAGAADALGAGDGDVDAGIEQHVQNALARRHRNDAPAAMQLHLEAGRLSRSRIVRHRIRPVALRATMRSRNRRRAWLPYAGGRNRPMTWSRAA